MTFYSARAAAFRAMLSPNMYGTEFTHKGVTYRCIADPLSISKKMGPDNYTEEVPATVAMWAQDQSINDRGFSSSGITVNDTITLFGFTMQVREIMPDNKEPTRDLRVSRKQ